MREGNTPCHTLCLGGQLCWVVVRCTLRPPQRLSSSIWRPPASWKYCTLVQVPMPDGVTRIVDVALGATSIAALSGLPLPCAPARRAAPRQRRYRLIAHSIGEEERELENCRRTTRRGRWHMKARRKSPLFTRAPACSVSRLADAHVLYTSGSNDEGQLVRPHSVALLPLSSFLSSRVPFAAQPLA